MQHGQHSHELGGGKTVSRPGGGYGKRVNESRVIARMRAARTRRDRERAGSGKRMGVETVSEACRAGSWQEDERENGAGRPKNRSTGVRERRLSGKSAPKGPFPAQRLGTRRYQACSSDRGSTKVRTGRRRFSLLLNRYQLPAMFLIIYDISYGRYIISCT